MCLCVSGAGVLSRCQTVLPAVMLLMGCGGPQDLWAQGGCDAPCRAQVPKTAAATRPLPALNAHGEPARPHLIRCLINSLSGHTPFLQKQGPHPSQPRSRPEMGLELRHHPYLPLAASACGRAHGARYYSAGRRALLVFLLLAWLVPTGGDAHLPAVRQPGPPCLQCRYHSRTLQLRGVPMRAGTSQACRTWVTEPLWPSCPVLGILHFPQYSETSSGNFS